MNFEHSQDMAFAKEFHDINERDDTEVYKTREERFHEAFLYGYEETNYF